MRIIVVDDKEEERYLAETPLKGSGYEVETAANGMEALEKLRAGGFDMIVSDVLMPVMDGFRLCRECKGDEKLKDIPFVFHTATYKDERDEELASKVGADRFVRKPTEPEEFIRIIQGLFRDMEEGKIGPKRRVVEEQKEVLKLYSERLIAKLEKKMLELEAEIAQRKRSEERVEHLNSVLRAIRGVNQLIIREKDRQSLLEGACDNLIKTRGFHYAWIALLDESGSLLTHDEAGLGEDFLPIVEQLKRGRLPTCCQQALRQAGVAAIKDPSSTCSGCPLARESSRRGALAIRLGYGAKVYGVLVVSAPVEFMEDEEEQSLLQEAAGDIAFALYNMELEEEHKKAEQELELRAQLLDNVQDAVNLSDFDGNMVYVNETACTSLGYSREELLKMNFAGLDTAGYAHALKWRNQELTKKKHTIFETANIRKDGSVIPVEVHSQLIEVGGKKLVLSIDRDITERKRLEAERKEMEQKAQLASRLASVGEMASGITHEINNPLVGVIGFAQLLMEREDLPDDVREELKVIHDGGQRVASIVKGLLSFARQSKPERTYVDINQIIEISLKLRVYEMQTTNIEVITQLDPELLWTMADAGQLHQVFLNIIINAERELSLAHGKGNLQVKTETIDNTIRISFKDDGPGIAKENLDRIFDPFFTTREAGQGTGLGLSICHGIIAEHNGRIYAESEPGRGATFIVELPVISEEKQLEMAEPAEGEPEKVTEARILVVDDEPTNLQYLSELLAEEGHEVETVDNGGDALKKIEEGGYALILADIKMPGMSGMELYKRVKKAFPSLAGKVVFITGDVMGEDTMKFLSSTKAPYITKPFDNKKLKATINRVLSKGP